MALQVWLPLDGDTRNLGLDKDYDVPSASSYPVWADDGKIGPKSLYPSTTTSGVLKYSKTLSNQHNYTITVWANNQENTTNTSRFIVWTGNASNGQGFGIRYFNSGTYAAFYVFGTYIVAYIGYNEWHHLVLVIDYDNLKFSAYVDGTLVDTKIYSSGTVLDYGFNIGWLRPSYYPFLGYINDVRVYDHCLSPKEIKEISKGLVLHYTLDDPSIELSKCKSVTWNQMVQQVSANTSYVTLDQTVTTEKRYIMNSTTTSSTRFIYTSSGTVIPSNHKAYVKLTFKSNFTNTPYLRYQYDTGSYHSMYCQNYRKNEWCTISSISNGGFNPTTSNTGVLASTNNYIQGEYFSLPNVGGLFAIDLTTMFGIGNEPTLAECEIMFPMVYYPYDTGTVKDLSLPVPDVSGYSRNGTISGSMNLNSSTPRYSKSAAFPTVNDYITIPLLPLTEFTYSFWFKRDRVSQTNREMLMTGWYGISFELNTSNTLTFKCNCTSSHISKNVTTTTIFDSTSDWNHVAFTHTDGIGSKIYVNGVLDKSLSFTEPMTYTATTATIGRYSSSTYNFVGKMSDFRIYSTELSASDIQELYNTSGSIDNLGNLSGFDFIEQTENIFRLEDLLVAANQSSTVRTFDYTMYAGEYAVPLSPSFFYYGNGDDRNVFLKDKFIPNTQYKIDIWINADDVVYNGTNRPSGICIRYTDGTTNDTSLVCVGNQSSPLGFQHMTLITDASKSVLGLVIRYNVWIAAYYRWDSLIIPISSKTTVTKTGIVTTGQFREDCNPAQLCNGDHFDSHKLIEI